MGIEWREGCRPYAVAAMRDGDHSISIAMGAAGAPRSFRLAREGGHTVSITASALLWTPALVSGDRIFCRPSIAIYSEDGQAA